MSAIEELLELSESLENTWNALHDVAPELTDKLRELLKSVGDAENKAKTELRTLGAGNHTFGDFSFSVRPGPKKSVFDMEEVLMEAEDYGHLDALLDAGFLTYTVNGDQLSRLPDELRAVYSKFEKTKIGTARVHLPKNLWQ